MLKLIIKRTLAAIEIILLIFILYFFAWARFNAKLSTPFYLTFTATRVLINIGITVAVIFRVTQLIKLSIIGSLPQLKLQILALGLYLIMIAPDLYKFVKWNIYANLYFYITAILLAPLFLGMITTFINGKESKIYNQ